MNNSEQMLHNVEQRYAGSEQEFFEKSCLAQAIMMLRLAQSVLLTPTLEVMIAFTVEDDDDVQEMEAAMCARFGREKTRAGITNCILTLLPSWYAINADQIDASVVI